jgi:acyl-coenzyme A thioesterase PaaI-like protein
MERWTFGAEPLAQTERAAALLRRVTGLIQALEQEQPAVEFLIQSLAEAEIVLASVVPTGTAPRVGAAASGDGRVYLDHARDIGAFNPCFPEYEIEVEEDHAHGTVAFPIAYEGPPGIVHGGFLAVFFDCVVQHHNCDVGTAGKTTSLALRYRRPVPLLATLQFMVERSTTDGRIHSVARLLTGELVLCEAEIDAVAGDRTALPEVSPRKDRS